MSLDAYSLCPGGTGKKIKFCCGGDFLPELQKIDRMFEGEQYLACLQTIDALMAKEPGRDRECLLALKCRLLRITEQAEAARHVATTFLAKYPNNQLALAEMAMLTAAEKPTAALDLITRALRAAEGKLERSTYEAMAIVAIGLLQAGYPLPARALFQMQCDILENDPRPAECLEGFCQATDIPLWLREEPILENAPDEAPWRDRYDEALLLVTLGDWPAAAECAASLAADWPDATFLWRALAIFRGWTADNEGAREAWRRYAALRAAEPDGFEDAAEAEALALLLSNDPLGDRLDAWQLTWTVRDVERAHEALLSSARFDPVSFDPVLFSNAETPPPKGIFLVLDRPAPTTADGLTVEAMPWVAARSFLYGRQTDRDALFAVMGVEADRRESILELVRATVGDALEPEPKEQKTGSLSATQRLLRPMWRPPRDLLPERYAALASEYVRKGVLELWPDVKLGALDGLSPREAAADPALRTRTAAAVLVLESWLPPLGDAPDVNELRTALGLPVLGPIDLAGQPVEAMEKLPVGRLKRLVVEGLSDEVLLAAFYRAEDYAEWEAAAKLGAAIVARPSLAESAERLFALSRLAGLERDSGKSLEYLAEGRRTADAMKQSHATWDLFELMHHFKHRNGQEAARLINHVQQWHGREPGVSERLARILIDVGLLRPDGTPTMHPTAADEASPELAPAAAAEPAGLWTPDSAAPAAGGKLWTPE